MRHLDLFSGIGGFALAARWCGWQTVGFCERDEWAQRVLAKNFPGVPIHDDIHTLTGDIVRDWGGADVLTGGFPCQPFSRAGKRRGADDDRALWPEMRRVIAEVRPTWVLGENVDGIIKMELDSVLSDLEDEGYAYWTAVVPACAVGAPHRRDRVWVVAHADIDGDNWFPVDVEAGCRELGASPADGDNRQRHGADQAVRTRGATPDHRHRWDAEPPLPRMDDGLPEGLDYVRGLGNAIVPQVAYEIMRLMS